jgi:hypothetical protein
MAFLINTPTQSPHKAQQTKPVVRRVGLGRQLRHRALLQEKFSTSIEEKHTECTVEQAGSDIFVLVTCERAVS